MTAQEELQAIIADAKAWKWMPELFDQIPEIRAIRTAERVRKGDDKDLTTNFFVVNGCKQ